MRRIAAIFVAGAVAFAASSTMAETPPDAVEGAPRAVPIQVLSAVSAAPTSGVIIVGDGGAPVVTAAPVTPVTGAPATAVAEPAPEQIVTASLGGTDRGIRPTRQGFPDPAIIVGEPLDAVPTIDPALAAGVVTAADRRRLRTDDPDSFRALLGSGALDPAGDDLARQIQAELQSRGCYSGQLDGVWGGGSRAAVERFTQQASLRGLSVDPNIDLFRALADSDATCPAPVATRTSPQTTRPTATRSQPAAISRRTTGSQRAAPSATRTVRQPAATTPARPAQGGGISAGLRGSGMIR